MPSTLTSKQLIINNINLPKELIHIVKEYTFQTIVNKTKKNINNITRLISNSTWNTMSDMYNDMYVFWIPEDVKSPQMQIIFCAYCGNYSSRYHKECATTAMCKCDNLD